MTITYRLGILTPLAVAGLLLAQAPAAFAERGDGPGGERGAHPRAGQRQAEPQRRNGGAGTGKPSGRKTRQGGRVGDVLTRASLARTHILLRVARATVKRSGSGRARFRAAALRQRAAGIALRRDMPRTALHLTRAARAIARDIIAGNQASEPAETADKPGEFDTTDGSGAERFIDAAKKQRKDPRISLSIGRSGTLLVAAVRTSKRGGKGGRSARQAAVYQRAARAASQKGEWKTALHLTGKSRESAREALAANGEEAPAGTSDETGEFAEASAAGGDAYLEAADASVPAEVDEQVIESWDAEASDDLDPTTGVEAAADVEFDTYEYDLETGAISTPEVETDAGEK